MSLIPFDAIVHAWKSPGPVSSEYLMAPEDITCIVGPFGSGKTTTSFMKGLLLSTMVPPSPQDGVRYAKGVVVRDTYPNLDKTTISSFKINFPTDGDTFKGGGGGPAVSTLDFAMPDGTTLHQEIIFAAIGDANVKAFCDGFEATWAFINGLDTMPADIISYLFGRLGRWPPPMHRRPGWENDKKLCCKMSADMNMPDLDNWTYGDAKNQIPGFVENVPDGWKLFVQPGGMDEGAENLEGVGGRSYYENLVRLNHTKKWWVRRFVHNKWGFSQDGEAVYPNFDDERHVAKEPIKFNPRRKLLLGLDAGGTPAAVAAQRGENGALNILSEYIPGKCGAKKFSKGLSLWLAENFPGAEVQAWADPASMDPTQDADEDSCWLTTVAEFAEIDIAPAPSNLWTPRFSAVDDLLTQFVEGKPQFLLSPECPVLRRGFNSGYKFAKVRVHGDAVLTGEPVKNEYSHPQDAVQYVALGSGDYSGLMKREAHRNNRKTVEDVMRSPYD